MDLFASLHPKFVHFPIALFLTYSLLEIIGIVFKKDIFSKSAFIILVLAILGSVAAVLTGDQASQAAEKLTGLFKGAIDEHEEYATATLWYFFGVIAFRIYLVIKKKFTGWLKYSFIILSLIGSFLIYETALLGGKLVYQHGVGTDLLKPGNAVKK